MSKNSENQFTWGYLRTRVGDVAHVISARAVTLTDGPSIGARAIEVNVLGGISTLILVDRGMDIGPAYFQGVPLHWTSSTGITHPGLFQDHDWLRSFHGGLMVTAGLRNVGPGFTHEDEVQPIHGRFSNTPAHEVSHSIDLDDQGIPTLTISGKIRETSVYGCNLLLKRSYTFKVGSPAIVLNDTILNEGFSEVEALILYHFNFGYPIVSETSELLLSSDQIESREKLEGDLKSLSRNFTPPEEGFTAQVFEHLFDESNASRFAGIWNPTIAGRESGMGLAIRYQDSILNHLWHWRMLGEGMYLTGIEPSNCGIHGRDNNGSATGTFLKPMESVETHLEVLAFSQREAINTLGQTMDNLSQTLD